MAFERVCALSEVPENGALRVELADIDVRLAALAAELSDAQKLRQHAVETEQRLANVELYVDQQLTSAESSGRLWCAVMNDPR